MVINDDEALQGFEKLCKLEGIIPALESSHAIGYAIDYAAGLDKDDVVIINLSGRGDKDTNTIMKYYSSGKTNLDELNK